MKLVIYVVFLLSTHSIIAQSQSELTKSSGDDLHKKTKEMKHLVRKINQQYLRDTLFIRNFAEAQRLWQLYYRAQVAMMFPAYQEPMGSDHSMCMTTYAKELVEKRIVELKLWVKPGNEDPNCLSSITNNQR